MKIEIKKWWPLMLALIGLAVLAAAPERAQVGTDKVNSLNSSDEWVATAVSDAATPGDVYVEEGANVFIECANAGYFINAQADSGVATAAKMLSCSAAQQFGVGLLRNNNGYVSYLSSSGVGTMKVFRRR